MEKYFFHIYGRLRYDVLRPTINMEIPTAKYGKTTKNMEKIHVIMRVKIQ